MKLSERSYPHPVVGNADDVPGAAFQATYEFSADKAFYYIDVTVACSSTTLNKLIEKGKAAYTLHLECSNTMFRRAYEFTEDQHRVQIPASQLNDTVQINAFILAKRAIPNYQIDGCHEDYGDAEFPIRNGDMLAVAQGETFEAQPQDSLHNVGTVMQIEEADSPGDQPVAADYMSDKIRVFLSKPDFKSYQLLSPNKAFATVLSTVFVLPVLVQAIQFVEADDSSDFEGYRWFKVIRQRLEALPEASGKDALVKAQLLLSLPMRRALGAVQSHLESGS